MTKGIKLNLDAVNNDDLHHQIKIDTQNDYSHIAHDCNVSFDLTAAESAAVLQAYDNGLNSLNQGQKQHLDIVISKIKDQIHP